MKNNSILDIIGPSMVGPSSSHSAGAIRVGLMAKHIYGFDAKVVNITFYNSFAKTGKGHGSDKAIIGGLLGYEVDSFKIKNSYEIAKEKNVSFNFYFKESEKRHPNSIDIEFLEPKKMLISANSVGAGEIEVINIDGYETNLKGDFPSLILGYKDMPGMIREVSSILNSYNVNIATMECKRKYKGEQASMVICLDSDISKETIFEIEKIHDMEFVRYIDVLKR